jgi:hypothetical protein
MASTSRVARSLKDEEVIDIFEDLPSDLSEFESDSANDVECSLSGAAKLTVRVKKQSHKRRNYAQTCSSGVVVILFQNITHSVMKIQAFQLI